MDIKKIPLDYFICRAEKCRLVFEKKMIRTGKKGSTLAEMLLTVLLMGIVLSATASGTGALLSSYKKIVKKSEGITLMTALTSSINAELKSAIPNPVTDKIVDEDGYIQSGLRGYKVRFVNHDDRVCLETINAAGNNEYVQLVSPAMYTNKLGDVVVELSNLGSDAEPNYYPFNDEYFHYQLKVSNKNNSSDIIESQECYVRPACAN